MRRKWQIIIALGLLVLSLALIYFWKNPGKKLEDTVSVWLAAEDIKAGAFLGEVSLEKVEIKKGLLQNTLDRPEEHKDKVFLYDLKKGDPVLESAVALKGSGQGHKVIIEGNQLYSLHLKPEQANGNWLFEGNLLDIYVNFPAKIYTDFSETEENLEPQQVIIREVSLVKIIKSLDENKQAGPGSNPQIFIFELSPEEISILNTARQKNAFISIGVRKND